VLPVGHNRDALVRRGEVVADASSARAQLTFNDRQTSRGGEGDEPAYHRSDFTGLGWSKTRFVSGDRSRLGLGTTRKYLRDLQHLWVTDNRRTQTSGMIHDDDTTSCCGALEERP
jgi:hypothetical protein